MNDENAVVSGVEEARKAVKQAIYDGADCIKVAVGAYGLHRSVEEMKATVDEAHRAGKKVAAHTVGDPDARTAVEAGVDSIEHGYGIRDATLQNVAAQGIFLVLTEPDFESDDVWENLYKMTPEQVARMRDRRGKRIAAAMRAGVRIAFGSDAYTRNPTWSRGWVAL